MLKNYSVIPFKNFYCSQNYDGTYSHYSQSHSTNGIKSYPIDVVDDIYCGCDEMKIVKINGVDNTTVNQIFVQSTTPVIMPCGTYYVTYLITHPTDSDIKTNLYLGKILHRGEFLIHKGTDGGVGAHIDLVIAKSLQTGWVQNSSLEWVLPDSIKPEDGFYLDTSFTIISNTNGINFQTLPADAYLTIPTPVVENKEVDQIEVICGDNTLRVRTSASTNGNIIGFVKQGIYNVISVFKDDIYIWYQVELGKWFANVEGCTKFIPKYDTPITEDEQTDTPITNNPTEDDSNNKEKFTDKIIKILLLILEAIAKFLKGGK